MTKPIVLSVYGTRPEAIKMAPVIARLRERAGEIESVVCAAGQHRELLQQVRQVFDLQPDFDLDLMRPGQSLAGLTAALTTELDAVAEQVQPDWILAQGDTTTTMVCALVAYYRGIKFGHVEAGLRTGDRQSPFPEEVNRRIADLVAELYFAPTARARNALLAEGTPAHRIRVTGNTVVDALHAVGGRPHDLSLGPLRNVSSDARVVLVTVHRRESFGEPLRELCQAIRDLARTFASAGVHVVFPVHPNPNVREPVQRQLSGLPNVSLIEPLGYVDFVHLMKRSTLILTDSGGVQEEAPSFGVPVLVMRDTTERPEGVDAGFARLVGTDRARIVSEANTFLRGTASILASHRGANPYGDGHAAERIVEALLQHSRTHAQSAVGKHRPADLQWGSVA